MPIIVKILRETSIDNAMKVDRELQTGPGGAQINEGEYNDVSPRTYHSYYYID